MSGLLKRLHLHRPAFIFVALVLILTIIVPSLFWPQKAEAAIATRGAATTAVTNNGTTTSIGLPAGVLEGDVLVAVIADSTGTTITAPSGWTRVSPNNGTPTTCIGGANVTTVQVWYKVASATEGGPYSFALNATTYAAGGIQAYSGVDTATTIDNTTIGACSNSAGASTALNTSAFNTLSANARIINVWGQMTNTGASNTITIEAALTSRIAATSTNTCGLLCNSAEATVSMSDATQAVAGTSAVRTATSSQSGQSTGYQLALRPSTPSTFSQSAYRWFSNIDSADYTAVVSNPSAGNDKANATAVDAANGYIYSAGFDSNGATSTPQWRIEKRKTATGDLCSAVVCGTQFGTNGVVTNDVGASTDEQINAIAIDVSGGVMYLGGFDSAGASSTRWRVEKRNLSDGALTAGFTTVTEDVASSTDERINAIAIDTTGGFMYLGGYDLIGGDKQWRVEKRSLSTGSLETAFNTTGIISGYSGTDSAKVDEVTSLVVDSAGNFIYIGGVDNTPPSAGKVQWRVEKRVASSGALGTNFGGSGVCTTAGVYCSDPNLNQDDQVTSLAIDSTQLFIGGFAEPSIGDFEWRVERVVLATNTVTTVLSDNFLSGASANDKIAALYTDATFIYVVGSGSSNGNEWRFQKRTVAGAVVAGFGDASSAVYSNPTSGDDKPDALAVDITGGFIYGVGYDSTNGNQWRLEKRNTSNGLNGFAPTAQSAQDTSYSATANQVVRLRMTLHIAVAALYPSTGQAFKLQFAAKSGTCDTGYVGETYADLTTSTSPVRYYDNPGPANATATIGITGDPAHGADGSTAQTYVDANNFTTPKSIAVNTDGLWDFAITEDGSTAFGGYCFRVVDSLGSLIATPSSVAEIAYCAIPRTTDVLTRGGSYFCDGSKRKFYWSL